jgi:ATP-dependent Lhr-like helicase
MKTFTTVMKQFHPLVARWFLEHVGEPTDLQEQVWPLIAGGEHVLISAPTGSGKTFAAFLWAIHQLISGKWRLGHTSVLYVSPLKALNYDSQRNLLVPLDGLRQMFEMGNVPFPHIRVMTRSGDTPPSDRRQMQRNPPEILITTPESLNLLLSSPVSRSILTGIQTVILDEIHAVVGTKRGVHLITAVDRLVPMSGEFQRIGLSATIEPIETIAEFLGGFRLEGDLRYRPRSVHVLESSVHKRYDIHLRFPEATMEAGDSFWHSFVDEIRAIIRRNRSTLIFVNSRRLCEKITHLINLGEERLVAYAHHGSLSREIRAEVEGKLKAGELKAIVATNSLELGIDIGALDEVVLIQSPPSLSSAIQRIGRAGHKVGGVSRATLFPTHPLDFIEAAVLASGVISHDIERTRPVDSALDVLAQIIISMVSTDTWDMDRLYHRIRTSYPYRNLAREHFDLVLNMLAGRYATTRLRELEPRISIDRLDNTVTARRGAVQALYFSGGTIPDRGHYHLRHHETHARIGELDEEFVWEAAVGQVFTLGTQNWRIGQITHNDVFVTPADSRRSAPPFWRAEENLRDFHFSERVAAFLETANDRLEEPAFQEFLCRAHSMEKTASGRLIQFLKKQKETTGCPLPHRHHLLVEFVSAGPGGYPGSQVVLHTLWGGRVNRPYAMAMEAAWESRFGHQLDLFSSDDCVMLQLPHETESEDILSLVTCDNVHDLLKKRLEGSGFFAARFRECAGRALLLTRRKFNERMPLWLNRLRSQKLLDALLPYEDFPLLLEAWRACLRDEFDLGALLQVLSELESGSIRWTETRTTHPSPMARSVNWPQINQYMYMDDQMRYGKTSRLRPDLIRDVVFTSQLRPAVSSELVRTFEQKRMRLAEGYSPDTSRDLLDWVKERLLIPLVEWRSLLAAIQRDHEVDEQTILSPIAHKLVRIHPHGAVEPLIVSLEMLPKIMLGFYSGDEVSVERMSSALQVAQERPDTQEDIEDVFASLLSDWLGFHGPITRFAVCSALGLDADRADAAIDDLADLERLVTGTLIKGSEEDYVCDAENFEVLLRLSRAEARPVFKPLDIQTLQPFLARRQGILEKQASPDTLSRRVEQLLCYPAPANAWETEILPARIKPYAPASLDSLMQEGDLSWIGQAKREICFCFRNDLDLVFEEDRAGKGDVEPVLNALFPDPRARYPFSTLLQERGSSPSDLADTLWNGVWNGQITNDTFAALRRAIETGFKVREAAFESRGRRKHTGRLFPRWKASLPFPGNWQRVIRPSQGDDLLEKEERNKDRARLLLDRYGILFRELLQNESPPFRWAAIFRALRLMELSGEVLTGYFFRGIPGPQFISHEAFRALQRQRREDAVYWVSAIDPASLCGIPLLALKGKLPRRVAGTHLVYRGSALVMVSQQNGKRLTFRVPPDDPRMLAYLEFLRVLTSRQFRPQRRIVIESINEEPAGRSPYLDAFRTGFDISVDYKKVTLYSRQI